MAMAFLVLLCGIVFVVVAITIFKIHPFLALILAAFLVGLLSPLPLGMKEEVEFEQVGLKARLDNGEITPSEYRELSLTAGLQCLDAIS